jgi:hypothetical protein
MHIYGFTTIMGRDWFDIIPYLSLRHDAIERRATASATMLTEKQKQWTATLGTDIQQLSGQRRMRWRVSGIEHVEPVCHAIYTQLVKYSLILFEAYITTEDVMRVLADDSASLRMYSPLCLGRARKAIIAAHLLGDEDAFWQIVENKNSYIESNSFLGREELKWYLELVHEIADDFRKHRSSN